MSDYRVDIIYSNELRARELQEIWNLFSGRYINRAMWCITISVIIKFIHFNSMFFLWNLSTLSTYYIVLTYAATVAEFTLLFGGGFLIGLMGIFAWFKQGYLQLLRDPAATFRQYSIAFDDDGLTEYEDPSTDAGVRLPWGHFKKYQISPTSIKLFVKNTVVRIYPRECLGDAAFLAMIRILVEQNPKGELLSSDT